MGGNTFWNFRRQGGDKTWKPSVVGYGYFLELPISKIYSTVSIHLHLPIAKKVVNDNLRLVDFQSWLLHEMDSVLNLPDTHFY